MSKSLTKIPAFGLENTEWCAFDAYVTKAVEKAIESNTVEVGKIGRKLRSLQNMQKVFECIPLLGIIVGIVSFVDFCCKKDRNRYSIHFVERHLIAASGLGFLFLPVADIIATIVRNKQAAR